MRVETELTVTSEQFDEDGDLPKSAAHPSVGGQNRSPQLSVADVPTHARSIAITCWDPDAPTTVGFCHWVRFGIPPSIEALEEGAGTEKGSWTDGFTDWGESSYGGMAPPAGDQAHHYQFSVYALDLDEADLARAGLGAHTTYAMLRFAIRGHVLASATLTGRYAVR